MKKLQEPAYTTDPLRIVNGALIATAHHAQGRTVPVLIVDCNDRQDIKDVFTLHRTLGRLGNSRHAWLKGSGSTLRVLLRVDFIEPVETQIVMEFELPQQSMLIEMILQAECFYLQSGKAGDNVANTDGTPRILIEALSAGFESDWRRLHVDLLAPKYKAKGRPRAERIKMAEEEIAQMTALAQLRIPQD